MIHCHGKYRMCFPAHADYCYWKINEVITCFTYILLPSEKHSPLQWVFGFSYLVCVLAEYIMSLYYLVLLFYFVMFLIVTGYHSMHCMLLRNTEISHLLLVDIDTRIVVYYSRLSSRNILTWSWHAFVTSFYVPLYSITTLVRIKVNCHCNFKKIFS